MEAIFFLFKKGESLCVMNIPQIYIQIFWNP